MKLLHEQESNQIQSTIIGLHRLFPGRANEEQDDILSMQQQHLSAMILVRRM